jgi:hypothetical protein
VANGVESEILYRKSRKESQMKSKPMAVCYESTEPPERALMRIAGLADALGAHAVVIGGRDLLMPAATGSAPSIL